MFNGTRDKQKRLKARLDAVVHDGAIARLGLTTHDIQEHVQTLAEIFTNNQQGLTDNQVLACCRVVVAISDIASADKTGEYVYDLGNDLETLYTVMGRWFHARRSREESRKAARAVEKELRDKK